MNDRREPRIRILLGSSIASGPGKAALLEAIDETGSIAAAGRRMGMSYRRAWLLTKTMNFSLSRANRLSKPAITTCMVASRVGGFSNLTLAERRSLSRGPWVLSRSAADRRRGTGELYGLCGRSPQMYGWFTGSAADRRRGTGGSDLTGCARSAIARSWPQMRHWRPQCRTAG